MPTTPLSIDDLIEVLERDGNHRVLKRVPEVEHYRDFKTPGSKLPSGLLVDVETTGLDTAADKIIEIALLPFSFDRDGYIHSVLEGYAGLEDPGQMLSDEVKAITGLSNEDVANREFDDHAVESLVSKTDLVICHNAEFDRKFLERRFPCFESKFFACSFQEVDWKEEGILSGKLDYILFRLGWFYDAHRAMADCRATLHMLAQTLPVSGGPVLGALLAKARRPTVRVWALESPFAAKDVLKARGYRWNGGEDGRPKAWHIDVDEPEESAEIEWLAENVYHGNAGQLIAPAPETVRLTGKRRYSVRCWQTSP